MSEHGLEFEHVPAIPEKRNRKGVPETVRVTILDAGACGAACEHMAQVVGIHRFARAGGEERFTACGARSCGAVFPDCAPGGVAEVEIAVFVAFAVPDVQAPGRLVEVADLEARQFGCEPT